MRKEKDEVKTGWRERRELRYDFDFELSFGRLALDLLGGIKNVALDITVGRKALLSRDISEREKRRPTSTP